MGSQIQISEKDLQNSASLVQNLQVKVLSIPEHFNFLPVLIGVVSLPFTCCGWMEDWNSMWRMEFCLRKLHYSVGMCQVHFSFFP